MGRLETDFFLKIFRPNSAAANFERRSLFRIKTFTTFPACIFAFLQTNSFSAITTIKKFCKLQNVNPTPAIT